MERVKPAGHRKWRPSEEGETMGVHEIDDLAGIYERQNYKEGGG